MSNLAQLAFEYIWLLQFGSDDQIDPRYAVKRLEEVGLMLREFTTEEQDALVAVARDVKRRINAPPDEYGYQPGRYATEEQRALIEGIINKEIFQEDYEY